MILAPSPNFRTTDEDKKMLAFFDLLVERSSWISSEEEEETSNLEDEEDEDENDDDDDDNEYSTSHSTGSENEESFEIDSVSTPSSSSTDTEEPVAGPSGIQSNNLDETPKLDLPSQFYRRFPLRITLETSSPEDDGNVESLSSTQDKNQEPVVFRSLPETRKRQFRRRTNSSTSSSS